METIDFQYFIKLFRGLNDKDKGSFARAVYCYKIFVTNSTNLIADKFDILLSMLDLANKNYYDSKCPPASKNVREIRKIQMSLISNEKLRRNVYNLDYNLASDMAMLLYLKKRSCSSMMSIIPDILNITFLCTLIINLSMEIEECIEDQNFILFAAIEYAACVVFGQYELTKDLKDYILNSTFFHDGLSEQEIMSLMPRSMMNLCYFENCTNVKIEYWLKVIRQQFFDQRYEIVRSKQNNNYDLVHTASKQLFNFSLIHSEMKVPPSLWLGAHQ
jgi:hypothetical protein